MITFDQFISKYDQKYVDVDGFPKSHPAQCWDLWCKYAMECWDTPKSATHTITGWACGVYTHQWPANAELRKRFDRLGPDVSPRKGDVAFWYNPGASSLRNHVAIVIADEGSRLYTFTQNPVPASRHRLPKTGIIGYLRPKTNQSKEDDMPTPSELWNYELGRDAQTGKDNWPAWMRLSRAQQNTDDMKALLSRTDDAAGGDTTGNIYERVCYMDKRIREMESVLSRRDDAADEGETNGNIYERVCFMDKRIRDMESKINQIFDLVKG